MPPDDPSHEKLTPAAAEVIAAIPVRYASTRLPGKPLAEIAGVPMIERVYRRAQRAERLSSVVVLTDDERIAQVVEGFGGAVEMTPEECASGTDRIAYAARNWSAAAVLNVQGDEPLIDPGSLDLLASHLLDHPADPVATLACPAEEGDLDSPDAVKVVTDLRGYALYFSRSAIPFQRNPGPAQVLRHIGVYGYQRRALLDIASQPPSPLEQTESLEQLRMLESGFSIRVLETRRAWPGIDTMEDLRRMEQLLRERPELARL